MDANMIIQAQNVSMVYGIVIGIFIGIAISFVYSQYKLIKKPDT